MSCSQTANACANTTAPHPAGRRTRAKYGTRTTGRRIVANCTAYNPIAFCTTGCRKSCEYLRTIVVKVFRRYLCFSLMHCSCRPRTTASLTPDHVLNSPREPLYRTSARVTFSVAGISACSMQQNQATIRYPVSSSRGAYEPAGSRYAGSGGDHHTVGTGKPVSKPTALRMAMPIDLDVLSVSDSSVCLSTPPSG